MRHSAARAKPGEVFGGDGDSDIFRFGATSGDGSLESRAVVDDVVAVGKDNAGGRGGSRVFEPSRYRRRLRGLGRECPSLTLVPLPLKVQRPLRGRGGGRGVWGRTGTRKRHGMLVRETEIAVVREPAAETFRSLCQNEFKVVG